MTKNKVKLIQKLLSRLSKVYPGFAFSEEVAEVWAEELTGLTYGDVKQAISEHIKTSKYKPTVAEVRLLAIPYRSQRLAKIMSQKINLEEKTYDPEIAARNRALVEELIQKIGGK